MTIIRGKEDKKLGYIHSNCIVSDGNAEVVGVVLGNCVYNKWGKLKGKVIHDTIYSTKGEKIATQRPAELKSDLINFSKIKHQSWLVLDSIKDYNSPWVEPKEKWSEFSLEDLLNS